MEDIFQLDTKYNDRVILTEEDQGKVKIFCKEPYAQELYDLFVENSQANGVFVPNKDFTVGQLCRVVAKRIDITNKVIETESMNSGHPIYIKFRDFSEDPKKLMSGEFPTEFNVILIKTDKHEYYGSEKKSLAITYRQELEIFNDENKPFDVKIERIIRGGFIAKYKETINCFIPGSHAAANIIHDFSEYIGRTIPVMIDNYDTANDLYIVSYKKYIKHTMPTKITSLKFNKAYTGVLTNHPYDFGMFIEFDGYFTGLIHKSEFEDYDESRKKYHLGSEMTFYIKDVTYKKGEYRIFLTLGLDGVNKEKLMWTTIKDKTENKTFEYKVNSRTHKISIDVDGQGLEIAIKNRDLKRNFNEYPFVKVFNVDPVNRKLKFDFVEE